MRVIGTAFNIRRDASSTRVSVSRGIVQVADIQNPAQAVRLTIGESVSRDDATDRAVVSRLGADDAQAWRVGRLIYDDRPSPCRQYSCVGDDRIWKDFDAMELNQEWIDDRLGTGPGPVEIFMSVEAADSR